MYSPKLDGIDKSVQSVLYSQSPPPSELAGMVHCFWELKTVAELQEALCYHALPDACVNVLFNQRDTKIAGLTMLRTKAEVLNLGTSFHYVGIQLYPGVWVGKNEELFDRFVGAPYLGNLPLVEASERMSALDFGGKQPILAELVQWLYEKKLLRNDVVTQKILLHLDQIRSVADMATLVQLSPRQLQRRLKETVGLSPHDFLKVLRVQQSFSKHYLELYADQAHYIHSFRKVTGYTPKKYIAKFDV